VKCSCWLCGGGIFSLWFKSVMRLNMSRQQISLPD